MSFLVPVYLFAGIGAAAIVIGLHFIVMRQPPHEVLPTARFIPMRPAVARTVSRRPEDLVLLFLRTAALVLLGAAFARPVWHPKRAAVLRVVVADRSRAVGDAREVADSARRLLASAGDVLVVFDSTARVIAADSLTAMKRSAARGAISGALVRALRMTAGLKDRADSIEVVVVSPAIAEEVDAATDSIRGVWPGAVRLVRVAARVDSSSATRSTVTWPADGHLVGASPRAHVDTVTAVVAGNAVVIAPFERRWRLDTARARTVARWVDGEPAAVERANCVRDVAIPVPAEGDLVLRPEFRRFETRLRAPCAAGASRAGTMPAVWAVDSTRPRRVDTRLVAAAVVSPSALMTWLLGMAAVALIVEPVARRWRARRAPL